MQFDHIGKKYDIDFSHVKSYNIFLSIEEGVVHEPSRSD